MVRHDRTPRLPGRLAALLCVAGVLCGCATPPSPPPAGPAQLPGEAPIGQRFAQWVAAFRASARAAGIDDATLAAAFDRVQYLPAVVERDRAQPEFVRPVWDYLDAAVSPRRVRSEERRVGKECR